MEAERGKYRCVFAGSAVGREVLGDILTICHFGSTLDPDNPSQIGEHNVGVTVLAKMGVFSKGSLGEVIEALTNIIPEKEGEENEEDFGSLNRGFDSSGGE